MPAARVTPLVVVVLLFVAGGGLFWQQHTIAELRDRQAKLGQEVETLRAEIQSMKKLRPARGRGTDIEPSAGVVPSQNAKKAVATTPNNPVLPLAPRRTPEERARLHARYDPFLTRYGLSAEQMDRFVDLKFAIYDAQDDLQAAVEKNGARGGTAGVESLRSQLVSPMWNEIRQLLGAEGYKAYGDYEMLSGTRPLVTGIFSRAGTELTEQQTDQVARLVIANRQSYRAKPTDISTRMEIDWYSIAHAAEAFLSPAQVNVLRVQAERESKR